MPYALKLMTWNVQQLPDPFGPGDAGPRAAKVADAILLLPPREQPDVIAFNEVFNEDGRAQLSRMLRKNYGFVLTFLGHLAG
jgi:hypothetical protein